MTNLDERQEQLCATAPADFSDLTALFINCTLKRSPEPSHTQGLADRLDRDHASATASTVDVDPRRSTTTSPPASGPT